VASCCFIRRYATELKWPIYLATAGLDDEQKAMLMAIGIRMIEQGPENGDFLESRIEALRILRDTYSHILLLQDDFFLDRAPSYDALASTVEMMTENPEIVCTRLMPCPGPTGDVVFEKWREIIVEPYCYFSFQAGIWSVPWLMRFFEGVIKRATPLMAKYPQYSRNQFWLLVNPCEKGIGTDVAVELGGRFVGWPRAGRWSNAVYLSPWPYRPTAVEKGVLQPWAKKMLKREGF
jgi:hypothetical protein